MRLNSLLLCWRSLCVVGLAALVLAAPVDAGRADDEDGGSPGSSALVHPTSAFSLAGHRRAGPRRRRERFPPAGRGELAATTIDAASDYLRCRTARITPSAESTLAWEQFYAWTDARIRRFAGARRARGIEVDECAQEVWSDLMQRLQTFKADRARGSFGTWLYAVVRNKAADMARRRARQPSMSLSAPEAPDPGDVRDDPARLCEQRAERAAVRGALGEMKSRSSEQTYRVLHMRYLEGKGVGEVALALGMTPGQVWTREHRIKRNLRGLLEKSAHPRTETTHKTGTTR
ncbi:MAG: polymerase sigma factor, sigma-70 family [Phycisphaerales bacterium]|nr:polymerase sigma factor, sigma-70 family [Phycisphaerales bacterium]